MNFMRKHGILQNCVACPGPLLAGGCQGGCSKEMQLKVTNDSKDKFQWHCCKAHTLHKDYGSYKVKDIKLSIRHQSWLVDSKLSLETVLELVYLWSQGFTHSEVMHELKLSKKTVIEWFMFFRECCIYSVMEQSEQIGGNGVEVEIDESKFGKRKYHCGCKVEGQWVFGGHEKYNKHKIFMIPVHNRKATRSCHLLRSGLLQGQ